MPAQQRRSQTGGPSGPGLPEATTAAASSSSAGGGGSAGGGSGSAYNQATWLFPSSDFTNRDVGPTQGVGGDGATGAVALPIIGDTATILTYTVPKGRYGRITALGIDVQANSGAAFLQGVLPPELTFSIQIDGRPVKGYEQFNYLPGTVTTPTPIAGIMLKENQVVTILVTNNTLVHSTQFVAARIQGYLFSKNLQAKHQGYQS